MDDVQSISRKRKVENDLLSDLPLSIIHCILALIPIRDAIKTCILSRQWRYIWASLPRLVFDDNCVDKESDIFRESMKNFITSALFAHKGPIHSVSFQDIHPVSDLCLLWLARNGINELFIKMKYCYYNGSPLHSSIYSIQKLTRLELHGCKLFSPPPLTGFSCLRRLVLQLVRVSCASVESLVANSPLLESFTFFSMEKPSSSGFRFSSPNLKYFKFRELRGDFEEISLHAPLLAQVSVSLSGAGIATQHSQRLCQKSSVCNYTKFLGGFTNLESFKGYFYFTKYLSIGIEAYDRSLVFHHLKIIKLRRVCFHKISVALVIVHLIMGSPNLQELRLSACYDQIRKDALDASPVSLLDFGCTSNFSFSKLRVIEMSVVRGLPYEMEFIKFLLTSSPGLETMTLHLFTFKVLPVEIMNLMTELLSYSRASPNAKILLIRSG